VQLRKSFKAKILVLFEINQAFEDSPLTGVQGGTCAGCVVRDGGYPRIGGLILHSACTGNAERQWAVAREAVAGICSLFSFLSFQSRRVEASREGKNFPWGKLLAKAIPVG
jgi:hypothetical protein